MLAPILLATALAKPPAEPAVRPSVVLITLDTTRADHLGCYGAATAATPTIDGIARRGVRFTQALSPVPLTLPAHASLMSGRVPRRHGLRDNAGFKLDPNVPLLAERLRDAGYATAAYVSAAVLDREGGLDRGFSTYDDTVRVGDRQAFDYEERAASQTIDVLLPRLAELKPPFLLWLHLYDPHAPYVPPEPYRSRFKDRPYDGEIAFMDAQLARVLDALKRKGVTSYVAIVGDHGESLGEHGEDGHGVFLYQATQHVPLIVSGPGIPTGATVDAAVGLVDVAPTLLALLGLPALPDVDGRSLVPLMRGTRSVSPDYEMESLYPSDSFGWAPLRALRSGPYKYIDAPRPELYELPTDPRETRDLAGSIAKKATGLAQALAARTGAEAIPRPADDSATEERRERLSSLGYVSGSSAPTTGAIDPKDGVRLLADLDAGRRAIELGDPRDAFEPLGRLLAKNPDNIPARLALGQAQLATERTDDAIATYQSVTKLAPNNTLAWFELANAYAGKGTKDTAAVAHAKEAYERALTLSPRRADTYLNLAALEVSRRGPEEARATLLRARAAGVADPTIEAEIGVIELARKDGTAARSAFERALALNPRQPEALEGMGKLAYAGGDFGRAAGYYARALDEAPSAGLAKALGAIRLYQLHDRAGAREAFAKALALTASNDPDAADLRALVSELSR